MDVDEGGVISAAGSVTGRAGVIPAVMTHSSRYAQNRSFLSQFCGRYALVIVIRNLVTLEAPRYL